MSWATAIATLNASCRTRFGESVTYTPSGQPAFALIAVVSNGTPSEIPTTAPSSGNHVILGAALVDFATLPAPGDAFTIGARNYRVHDVQDDGDGWAEITAERID